MSLLMDALKKAEKAKKEQADKQQQPEAGADSDGTELSLDPIDRPLEMSPPDDGAPPEARPDEPLPPPPDAREQTGSGTGELTMEPGGDESLEMIPREALESEIAAEEATQVPPRREDSGSFELPEGLAAGDTSATLPSMKSARASVDRYFDGTGPIPQEAITDGASTMVSNRAVRAEQEAAKRVFAAQPPEEPRSGAGRWMFFGGIPLLLVALSAGGYYYWMTVTSGSAFAPRPGMQARTAPPRAMAPAPRPEPVTPAPVLPAAPPPAEPPAAVAQAPVAPTRGELSVREAIQGIATPAPAAPSPEEPAPAVESVASVASAIAEAPLASGPVPTYPTAAVPSYPAAAVPGTYATEGIRIARKSVPQRLDPTLNRAYKAYRAGDDRAAARAYRAVLKSDPGNRDALMGLGALALRDGDVDEAGRVYGRLLSLNPKDSVAQAALIGLHKTLDPLEGETRIKLLLQKEPEAVHLHFALGNLYAAQSRWREAQQAYFNAYRVDGSNPDVLFNLAVSLDQLGQGPTALEFYTRAVQLAKGRATGFDSSDALARIAALGGTARAE